MQTQVEIRYAGVVVAKASEARATEDGGLFLMLPEPMPVGTLVGVGPDAAAARVERVVESSEPSTAGMLVRATGGASIASVATSAEPLPPSLAAALAAPVGTVTATSTA